MGHLTVTACPGVRIVSPLQMPAELRGTLYVLYLIAGEQPHRISLYIPHSLSTVVAREPSPSLGKRFVS